MKRPEFVALLHNIGATQVEFARITGHNLIYVYQMGRDGRDLPRWVAATLKLIQEHQTAMLYMSLHMQGRVMCEHCHRLTKFTE